MDNQKLENLLNLAIETPVGQRERSLNLNVGYEEADRTWELIVKYNGDLSGLTALGIEAEELLAGYAILTVPEELVEQVAELEQIEYVEKPKRLFFSALDGREAACITPVSVRPPFLSGRGVLVAVIDSGIDYRSPHFRNSDGTSRIAYLWDQTGNAGSQGALHPPEGFRLGTEYTQEQINAALELTQAQGFLLVPSTDVSGHGTAVAAIAAGSAVRLPAAAAFGDGYLEGAAPESELIIVKLGIPGENAFPRTTELMRALTYVVRKAKQLGRPVAINLSFGNTYGAHDGASLVERFLDNIAEVGRNVVCVGSGNEGASAGHVQGMLSPDGEGQRAYVELAVGAYETVLNVQLWKNYVDQYRISVLAPDGERVLLPNVENGKQVVRLAGVTLLIYLGQPTPYAVTQEIYFDFIPDGSYIPSGIWLFELEAVSAVTGQFYFYLPAGDVRGAETRFLMPSPQVTLTIPSTAQKVITVGAYNSVYESYADFSGRGYVYAGRNVGILPGGVVKPDLAAPGVDITVPDVRGGYVLASGTSFAAPFVTGAAALLMEWGIVYGNDPFLYGEKVKAYLRRGAEPLRGETVYPNERVGAYGNIVSS